MIMQLLKYSFSQLRHPNSIPLNIVSNTQLFQAENQYKNIKDFPSYYEYIRMLARNQQYDQILKIYNQLPLAQRFRYWRHPDNNIVRSWIYDAYLKTKKPIPDENSFFMKVAMFVFWVIVPLYLIFEPEITIEILQKPKEEENTVQKPCKFKDVVGIDEYKEELQEIVDFLKNPQKYYDSGARLPRGILLVGRPGTGKTLLARALAQEAGCTFIYKSGAEFDEMYVGVGASRIKKLFQEAREKQPALIFIDEIDSIGAARSNDSDGGRRSTINQILTEMDGFRQHDAVIVIGATNMESVQYPTYQSLDKALTRAGRFDKVIHVMPPDVKGRKQLFEYYLTKVQHETIDTLLLSRQTSGLTGADIENIVNLAVMKAVKGHVVKARPEDFQHAIDRVRMGVRYKLNDQDKELTAYHEGGHALTNLLTNSTVPLNKVTILPRGGALGYTSMIPDEDQLSQTKSNILAQIDVAMGGRAAEDLKYGVDLISSGCGDDLARATELAYAFVTQMGMGDNLISDAQTSKRYDYSTDLQVKQILEASYGRVRLLLQKNMGTLHKFADCLLKYETVNADQLKELM